MDLNDAQLQAVGLRARPSAWQWAEVPTGPQPLPAWAKGLHIEWLDGYGNRPEYKLRADCDLRQWPGQAWEKSGGYYHARHEDGRLQQLVHRGELRFQPAAFWDSAARCRRETMRWQTPQDEGFGGHCFELQLTDGREAVLRGPWSGSSPAGYLPCSYIYLRGWRPMPGRRWWQVGGLAGLYITEDLWLRLLAFYHPTYRAARVWPVGLDGSRGRLEPVRPDMDAPKHMSPADQLPHPQEIAA